MINPDKIFGQLGNRMFQMAFLYAYARDNGCDFHFQDPKWFGKYREDIKKLYGEGVGYLPFIGIHVRRGDYLKPPHNEFHTDLCSTDYYEKAIEMFPNESFLVFSDDIVWCKEKWGMDNRFQFSEDGDLYTDMNGLASCKGQIITNSTFSWWGAFLCPFPSNKVVAPKEETWFKDKVIRTKLPSDWIQI